MAGLVKAKKYDWKDSNLALFGSDLEKNVKKAAAQTEKSWTGAGKKVGLEIWRIVKFNVATWPKRQYGEFFSGDSYIILNTYKEEGSEELLYDVHFWIGKDSTQDEYGTAAYKTVELDTLLDDKPVQHREVEGYESSLFRSYFPAITTMEGGADSGFYHVGPKEYKPRLFHFKGDKTKVDVRERVLSKNALNDNDVFILDLGEKVIQWNGSGANKDEKFRAADYLKRLRSNRGKCNAETYDGDDSDWTKLVEENLNDDPVEEDVEDVDNEFQPALFQLSDESGKSEFKKVNEGSFPRSKFVSDDVFIADTGKECFVWIGKKASQNEKRQAMSYAHDYLKNTSHPLVSISRVTEGCEGKSFSSILS